MLLNCPKLSILMSFTALGDYICALPALKALIQQDRLHKILTYPYRVPILEAAGIPKDKIFVLDEKERKAFPTEGSFVVDISADAGSAPFRMHLQDYCSINCCSAILKPEENSIPLARNLPRNKMAGRDYVVLSPVYMQPSRKMPTDIFDAIKDYLLKKDLEVVILGSVAMQDKKTFFAEYDLEYTINLIGETSLMESLAIISEAKCLVTMDSGLVYLAAMTDVPIVAGYTFVPPIHRLPYRYTEMGWKCIAVEPKIGCKFCSDTLGAYNVTFDSECPNGKDFQCASNLDSEDFIQAIASLI